MLSTDVHSCLQFRQETMGSTPTASVRRQGREELSWRKPSIGGFQSLRSFKRLCTGQHILTQSHPSCNPIADCTVLSSVLTVTSSRPRGPDMEYGHLTGAPLEPSKLCGHPNSMPQQNYERHFCVTRLAHGIGRLRHCLPNHWGFWPLPLRSQSE